MSETVHETQPDSTGVAAKSYAAKAYAAASATSRQKIGEVACRAMSRVCRVAASGARSM